MPAKGPSGADKRRRFEEEAMPHLDAVYSMATRLARNPDDAKDLVQETVLRAYRFFEQFEAGTNCRAWLLTILFNNFRNGYKRFAREQPASSAEEFERCIENASAERPQSESDPAALLTDRLLDREVERALDSLPDEFRSALLLIDVQDLSYHDAARVLKVPVGTMKSRVSRGRALLRRSLNRYAKERGIIRS
jgi:RNA polymerase sigma-70 factor (ECF subfamily)